MITTLLKDGIERDEVVAAVCKRDKLDRGAVLPFADCTSFLTELFTVLYEPSRRLLAVGHVSPDVGIAADRAELPIREVVGISPFDIDVDRTAEAIESPSDVLFVENPNRITGSTLSHSQLTALVKLIPEGVMIVDEFLYDLNGVTALPVLEAFENVIIIRGFCPESQATFADAGYAVGDRATISRLRDSVKESKLPPSVRNSVLPAITDSERLTERLRHVQRESLRVARRLSRLGVQHRMTAADFLLLRVASPSHVTDRLACRRVSVENLDRFPGLENYLRYRIQSSASNDRLLEAFDSMPRELYAMDSVDGRRTVLRRGGEGTAGTIWRKACPARGSLMSHRFTPGETEPESDTT